MRLFGLDVGWKVAATALVMGACSPGPDIEGTQRSPAPEVGNGEGGSSGTTGSVRPPAGPVPPPSSGSISLGPPVSAANAPPPISGGTLLITRDGRTAFATDPDRDAVYLADLTAEKLLAAVPLQAGDEPGRAVEDATGVVHVVLRRGGAVVTFDPRTRAVGERRPVCPAPRGIALDAQSGLLHVACTGGELVSLPAAGGPVTRVARLDRDLRDVVVRGSRLYVTTFRSAELLVVSTADGKIVERMRASGSKSATSAIMTPQGAMPAATIGVAWRMRPLPDGSVGILHQETTNTELGTDTGGYGGGPCRAPVGAAVSRYDDANAGASAHLAFLSLPVDFAYSADGKKIAIANAAPVNQGSMGRGIAAPRIVYGDAAAIGAGGCMISPPPPPPTDGEVLEFRQPVGDPIAVAFDGGGRLVVQTREPARLEILTHRGGTIKLSDESRLDSGHTIFHAATGSGLACATCHPEGGDDGRVWRFAKLGNRRTQNLRGGILQTAPFHWDGDMRDLGHLMQQVFTGRMGGGAVSPDHLQTLTSWLDRVPALPLTAPADAAAVERGRALFNDTKVACATCHGGALMTNNQNVDVGTGGPRQVPSLKGVAARAPFMSSGCAPTLQGRFDPSCGGGDRHGVTSHLDTAQLADLIAYMESL